MKVKEETLRWLKSNDLRAKKKYGQNFLIDNDILEDIAAIPNISKEDTIVEIGPGLGNLTEKLIKKAKRVIAFEIDEDMIKVLETRFAKESNLELVKKDILKVDIKDHIKSNEKIKIVANLPYYITTPILFKILEEWSDCTESMTVMVQKEVAERMISKSRSKDYGILTVNIDYYGTATKAFDVPNSAFLPQPNVTSSVTFIKIEKKHNVINKEIFFKFVKAAFSKRRKKLTNSLESTNFLGLTKEEINKILESNGIKENARAEELSVEEFVKVANYIAK
ncbi:MAG: 16S rRNA (adenine(1518)-N(6)/adenine(1519)-N(6))-dimethyltransferase RsmA [Clostridia bacterium]|nr:16S rRNA (adenine(1518)-N(6)/adenine(1519)-N(6))-dimethyltransferase RsmA [Clostridia bacterium]MDD4375256.1 16S rRNA (adenine(1518)-N(6)/adenine(1519)-N(6))-dimethyltransferase RsmA [Clostridia bacterium]